MEYGWTDRRTSPPGFRLNDQVKLIINMVPVYSLIAHIFEDNTEEKSGVILQLPPSIATWGTPIPPVVAAFSHSTGHSFVRKFSRVFPSYS